jgi:hypothetical protein
MDRRTRRAPLRAAFCAAACVLAAPVTAQAGYTDLNNWNLTESTSVWGGGTQFSISSGGPGLAEYRWLDDPDKTTVISANNCSDGGLRGSPATIPAHNTSYHTLFSGSVGTCFVLRGRTASGSGSMVNHDGRINR